MSGTYWVSLPLAVYLSVCIRVSLRLFRLVELCVCKHWEAGWQSAVLQQQQQL